MPSSRRSRRHQPYREMDLERATGGRTTQSRRGEEWTVQRVRGAEKSYVCPGCHQAVAPGTGHVVAWANDSIFGPEAALAERRHWHTACWDRGR